MHKKECLGCDNDFYNGKNPHGIKECWLLETAKLGVLYRIANDKPMNAKGAYQKKKLPNCYRQKGFCFLKRIPYYAEQL